jgi:NADP-dependent 3-hydroxy acid dehydrogenase YdfG
MHMTQTALILGASSGVGAATAKELARRGWTVVLAARSEAQLRQLCDSIGPCAHFRVCDATLASDMAELKEFTRQ